MTGYLTPEDFNPRSYKRSDYDGYHRALHPQISIHAPTRGATVNPKHYIGCTYFNPRSYKRSDMGRRFSVVVYKTYFNPRSYKRSDGSRDTTRKLFQNFNPRSYKRSDQSEAKPYEINKISIHAPTRGATEEVAKDFSKPMISIHAPTRGATISFAVGSTLSIFQSTLLQEERP